MQEIVDQVLEVRGAHRLREQPRPPTPSVPQPDVSPLAGEGLADPEVGADAS